MKTSTLPPLAYSYLRFSSPAQADGDSVRRQSSLRDGWLKRNPDVRLDNSLTLVDAGVSGYRGEHRTNKKHALASFLDLVERGRVPAGSYLIVENLDRLTRENPIVSIPAVLNLIVAGIRVVQLAPVEIVYDSGMEQHHLMNMLWELARGHAESRRKSGLCGEAWMAKKRQAREKKEAHGKAVPAWLELVDGAYRVKENAGRAVRLIFRWSAEGLGVTRILQRLAEEKVPAIGRSDSWQRGYVVKVLSSRAVLGEYQPMRGHGSRVPDGDPIAGYYPAVITEAEWFAAQAGRTARAGRSGRPAKKGSPALPFSGLLRSAQDDCSVYVITRRGRKHLVSSRAWTGEKDTQWCSFPLEPFQDAILSQLRELAASDLFAAAGSGKLAELEGRLDEVDKRLVVALGRFEADPESPTWADRVSHYDREKRALVRELADERQKVANPVAATWGEAVRLMAKKDPERLRAVLLLTIEGVWCLFVERGRLRVAAVQVWFKGGAHRDYLIAHRQAVGGSAGYQPALTRAIDFAAAAIRAGQDLRDRARAKRLEADLGRIDVEQLWEAMA